MELNLLYFELRIWRFRWKFSFAYEAPDNDERCQSLEMDHVIPISRGGRHAIANILPSCPPCNRSKNGSLLSEWRYTRRGVITPWTKQKPLS